MRWSEATPRDMQQSSVENLAVSSRLLHPDRYDTILMIGIILYGIFFSYLSLFRYNTFQLEYDLAIFNQAIWNTMAHGEILTNSLEHGSHFGIHFSPVLFSLVPVYALSPGPAMLLVAQSILLAFGALPVYLCARELLGRKTGCIIGLVFLLYPSLHGVNLYDFHEVAFLPLLLGMTLWGYVSGRRNVLLICAALSLLVKEDVSLIIMMIGFAGLWKNRQNPWTDRWQYILLIVMAFVALVIFFLVIQPLFAPSASVSSPGSLTQYLNPLSALSVHNENRVVYLMMTFLPLVFIPFLAPEILVISIPSFLEILLSPSPYYYSIMYQYSALVIPVLFFATIRGLFRIKSGSGMIGRRYFIPVLCLICISTLICSAVYSPAVKNLYLKGTIDEAAMEEHRDFLRQVLSVIPVEASVSAQYNLLPQISCRKEIWLDYTDKADIILIDSAFPKRAVDFDDNIPAITENFNLILNKNNLYLYVNKKNPALQAELQRALGISAGTGMGS